MSRRRGQSGHVEQRGDVFYVRFWTDVRGAEQRHRACVRLCTVQDGLTKSERERRARDVIQASGADTEARFREVSGANLGTTFRQQAEVWLDHARNRKRNPVKPVTAYNWERHVEKWLNPELGDKNLADIGNSALRQLVAHLAAEKLLPKSILNIVAIVKAVVASAVDEEGEQMFPRKWNHDYIDLPEVAEQNTPVFSEGSVSGIVGAATGWHRALYALLAGSGLRAGEALGLEIEKHCAEDFQTLVIRQSVWRGAVQAPKTPNAYRTIHLHSALAEVLKQHAGARRSGFLFTGIGALPVSSQSSILKRSLHPILKEMNLPMAGLHAFRRFRVTWLRKNRVPEDLIRHWIGHASKSVTDDYSRVAADQSFARECAERVGLGFDPGRGVAQAEEHTPYKGEGGSNPSAPTISDREVGRNGRNTVESGAPEVVGSVPVATMRP